MNNSLISITCRPHAVAEIKYLNCCIHSETCQNRIFKIIAHIFSSVRSRSVCGRQNIKPFSWWSTLDNAIDNGSNIGFYSHPVQQAERANLKFWSCINWTWLSVTTRYKRYMTVQKVELNWSISRWFVIYGVCAFTIRVANKIGKINKLTK